MAVIPSVQKTSKNGLGVELCSPDIDAATKILTYIKSVLSKSEYLLTEADEFTITLEQQIERIKSYREHADKVMITAEIGGDIVGLMDFSVGARRKIAHQGAFGMTVLPSLQNQGIGHLMLESLLHWASANPRIETVRLRVHAKNIGAVSLYEKLGFLREGSEVRGVRYGDGSYDDVILMRHDLNP